jgi:aryl-alcohol dehydrogenase-like predicted oxidoreductase
VVDVERTYDIIEVLHKIAARRDNVSIAQLALSWQLHQPHVTSVIVGAKSEQQLADNLAAAQVSLTSEELAEIDNVSKPQQIYPAWMAPLHADRRPGVKSDHSAFMRSTPL